MDRLVKAGVLVALLATVAAAQAAPASVVEWERAHLRTLHPVERDTSTGDLKSFTGLIGDARIIGLGESEHGIHEFYAFRNRFVQFSVESLAVTAIVGETGYNESTTVDDYIQGRGELTAAVVGDVFSWSSDAAYADNKALLEWLRAYNARPTTKRKVHFYGIDLTGGRAGQFVEARRSLDAALAYIATVDPAQERTLRAALEPLETRFSTSGYPSLSAEQKDSLTAEIDDLVALFERRSVVWPSATSPASFDRAYRSAIVARQLNANFRAAVAESNPQAQREVAMAQNLAWVLQQETPQGRVLLYEANWHISRGPMVSDRWGSSLGEHLRVAFGADYVAIATAYGEKNDGSQISKPDPTSLAALLAGSCASVCWLSLRDTPSEPAAQQWFKEMRPIVGGRVDQMVVNRAFDAVVFIQRVHPAKTLP